MSRSVISVPPADAAADVDSSVPFWWLGEARQLLCYDVEMLVGRACAGRLEVALSFRLATPSLQVPVFDRYLTLCQAEHFPISSAVDWKGFSNVFGGPQPQFEPEFVLRIFHRFRDSVGLVDMLQARRPPASGDVLFDECSVLCVCPGACGVDHGLLWPGGAKSARALPSVRLRLLGYV